jgi:hypothetical protein
VYYESSHPEEYSLDGWESSPVGWSTCEEEEQYEGEDWYATERDEDWEEEEEESAFVQGPESNPNPGTKVFTSLGTPEKGKGKGKGKGKQKGKNKGGKGSKGKPKGPSAEHPCSVCRSPEHWARECPNKSEGEKKLYEVKLAMLGNLDTEGLYLFDCMFAGMLKNPGIKEQVKKAEVEYDQYWATNPVVESAPSA